MDAFSTIFQPNGQPLELNTILHYIFERMVFSPPIYTYPIRIVSYLIYIGADWTFAPAGSNLPTYVLVGIASLEIYETMMFRQLRFLDVEEELQ